jgi:hypothetical protein
MARLVVGRNPLRRHSDQIEGVALIVLTAAFLAAACGAALLGLSFCRSQDAAAARLHPAVAVLSQGDPVSDTLAPSGQVLARWRAPDGQQRSGLLDTVTAPGITGKPAGARVRVWVDEAGQPVQPPSGPVMVAITAVIAGIGALGGAAIVLSLCYLLCRRELDRRRLAGWEASWARVGPKWTTRR